VERCLILIILLLRSLQIPISFGWMITETEFSTFSKWSTTTTGFCKSHISFSKTQQRKSGRKLKDLDMLSLTTRSLIPKLIASNVTMPTRIRKIKFSVISALRHIAMTVFTATTKPNTNKHWKILTKIFRYSALLCFR